MTAPVPGLEPAFEVDARLGPLEDHGMTRAGHRRVVPVAGGRISIRHRGLEVAAHVETSGRRQRVAVPAHLAGIGRGQPEKPAAAEPELLRPLAEYERAAGGGW